MIEVWEAMLVLILLGWLLAARAWRRHIRRPLEEFRA